jgi:hypothetical protein
MPEEGTSASARAAQAGGTLATWQLFDIGPVAGRAGTEITVGGLIFWSRSAARYPRCSRSSLTSRMPTETPGAAVRMAKQPSGPTARGTRCHEQVRIAPGLCLRIDSLVTQIEKPSLLGMDFHSHWFAGHLTYEIQAEAGGSVLRQHETLRPRARLFWNTPGTTTMTSSRRSPR